MLPKHTHLKLTKQRRIILEELRKLKTHPSADELYDIVRARLPKISLGTVYRNLEILSEHGVILKLGLAGGQKRFDADIRPHYHIRCTVCGCVRDLEFDRDFSALEKELVTDFKVTGHSLEFLGICRQCQQDMDQAAHF